MSESNVVLTLKDHLSQGFNSIANALTGFNKKQEEAERRSKALGKALNAEKDNLAKYQRQHDEAQQKLRKFKETHREVNDELSAGAFEAAQREVNDYAEQISAARRNIKDLGKQINECDNIQRRSNFFGGNKGGGTSNAGLQSKQAWATLGNMFADGLGDIGNAHISSAFGADTGALISSGLSGAISGAATGAMLGSAVPGLGTAIGAVVGAAAGLMKAGAQIFEKKDEYYKNAVQESYEGFKEAREELATSGSAVAAGREVDELAFNKLLGDGIGTEYLENLRGLAAHTPLEYNQLTEISRQLAIGFGDESDRMLDLIEVVGDAGSAVGLDAGGMVTIATALSRMQSSDKVTLEYLNLIQERGIDAIGLIGQAKGLTTAQVYNAISKGTLDGSDIVDVLQKGMTEKYGGAMEEQSQTYQGLSSTLQDQETERQNAAGEKYNETRTAGLQSQIAFNDSDIGQTVIATDAMGASAMAMGENLQEGFDRAALSFLHTGDGLGSGWSDAGREAMEKLREGYLETYAKWENEEDPVAKATLELRLKNYQDEARAQAEAAYSQSEFAKELAQADKDFIDGLQGAQANGYWQLGYEIGQQLSQGVLAGVRDTNPPDSDWDGSGFAYGLDRVPYNGYPAQLHEGERVLTAQQARQMDAAGGLAGGVVITGNNFTVREDADISRIASEFVRQLRAAQMNYASA